MARIKLDQLINTGSLYGVVNAAELLDNGGALVEKTTMETRRSEGRQITKYLYVLLDPVTRKPTDLAYEIGAKAYESRAAKGQALGAAQPVADPTIADAVAQQEAEQAPTFSNGVLTWKGFRLEAVYDADSESYTFDLPHYALGWKDLIAAMRSVFPVVEWDTAMYGETVIVNFCPADMNMPTEPEAAPVAQQESIVRYTVIRTDFALQIANKGKDCQFPCNFETEYGDLAYAYAVLGDESARLHKRREEYNAVALDPLPVPAVKTINGAIFRLEWQATVYKFGELVVIFRQTDTLNHRVTENCAMRLSKWNEYRAESE